MVVRQLGARAIRSLLHWLGFELVNRNAYMQDLARTAHLRSLFRALGIDKVIDIGANRGHFIRLGYWLSGDYGILKKVPSRLRPLLGRFGLDAHWYDTHATLSELDPTGRETARC